MHQTWLSLFIRWVFLQKKKMYSKHCSATIAVRPIINVNTTIKNQLEKTAGHFSVSVMNCLWLNIDCKQQRLPEKPHSSALEIMEIVNNDHVVHKLCLAELNNTSNCSTQPVIFTTTSLIVSLSDWIDKQVFPSLSNIPSGTTFKLIIYFNGCSNTHLISVLDNGCIIIGVNKRFLSCSLFPPLLISV